MYSKGNREWHVVVDNGELSDLFARYIDHDRDTARQDAGGAFAEPVTPPEVFAPLACAARRSGRGGAGRAGARRAAVAARYGFVHRAAAAVAGQLCAAGARTDRVGEQAAVPSGMYITWTAADRDRAFRDLLGHLADLSWRDPNDFDLRIIVNSRDAAQKVRVLAENGFNEAVFARQSRIHNKGIIADSRRVLVSSQNWSGDGFLRNRDAGVIIDNPDVAKYDEAIFLDDWANRTKPALTDGLTATLAMPGVATPPRMVRMSWREYDGD